MEVFGPGCALAAPSLAAFFATLPLMRSVILVFIGIGLIVLPGCVRRTISIDSSPSGALVWLNDREVGRTPLEVDFVFYGDYDVRIEHEDAEPIMTHASARPPLWDVPPLDFLAELMPVSLHSRVAWQFDLPPREDEARRLRERAESFRQDALQD